MPVAAILIAHAVLGLGGALLAVVFWIIAALLDDGSRYLCPRCGASLRPYVKSCRFCRARFKVQTMTPPTRGRQARLDGSQGRGVGVWPILLIVVGTIGAFIAVVFWLPKADSPSPATSAPGSVQQTIASPGEAPQRLVAKSGLEVSSTPLPAATPHELAASQASSFAPTSAGVRPLPSPVNPVASVADTRRSQEAAVTRYPALAMAGSSFNKIFLARLAAWKSVQDPRLNLANWPELLADECAAAIIGPRATPAPTATPLVADHASADSEVSGSSGSSGSVYVHGYTRKDGTYVHSYSRRR